MLVPSVAADSDITDDRKQPPLVNKSRVGFAGLATAAAQQHLKLATWEGVEIV